MNLSPEAAAIICVGSGAGIGLIAYGINRLAKKLKKPEPTLTQFGSLTPEQLELSKKVLKRRTEKTGAVSALDVLYQVVTDGEKVGRGYNVHDFGELLGTIAEAALPELDELIEKKYPKKDQNSDQTS